MLFLLFQLGKDRYALEASQVVEVLPVVELKRVPQAPRGVAGVFNYRGAPAPVIDLSDMALGKPAPARLNTRIIMVNYPVGSGSSRLLGLLVERATETLRREASEFTRTGVDVEGAPYLGPVTRDDRGLVQWIEIKALLSEPLREMLFREPLETR